MCGSALDEKLFERGVCGPRLEVATEHRGVPTSGGEPVHPDQLAHRLPCVMSSLDLRPVVAAGSPGVDWNTEAARVVRNRRLAYAQLIGDLGIGLAHRPEATHSLTLFLRGHHEHMFPRAADGAAVPFRRVLHGGSIWRLCITDESIADWCNGNTLLSGSRIRGSSPWSAVSGLGAGPYIGASEAATLRRMGHRSALIAAACAACALLVPIGCGGDDAPITSISTTETSSSPTRRATDFISAADSRCAEANAAIANLSTGTEVTAVSAGQQLEITSDLLEGLQSLDPPCRSGPRRLLRGPRRADQHPRGAGVRRHQRRHGDGRRAGDRARRRTVGRPLGRHRLRLRGVRSGGHDAARVERSRPSPYRAPSPRRSPRSSRLR